MHKKIFFFIIILRFGIHGYVGGVETGHLLVNSLPVFLVKKTRNLASLKNIMFNNRFSVVQQNNGVLFSVSNSVDFFYVCKLKGMAGFEL